MTTTNDLRTIRRETFDGIRVEIEADGFVYVGMYAVNRKPLTADQYMLVAGVTSLCDAAEMKTLVKLARNPKLDTPGALLAAIEAEKTKTPRVRKWVTLASSRVINGWIHIDTWRVPASSVAP